MTRVLDAPRSGEESPQRQFYSVSEAAALLGVSRVTVWRWIKAGRLTSARLGHRTVRLQHADVVRLVEQRSSPAAAVGQMPTAERGHFVLFYESDAYLARSVAEFLFAGLKRGNPTLVVATPPHRAAIVDRLVESGLDPSAARDAGLLTEVDAADALDRIMVGDRPDPARFDDVIGRLVAHLGRRTPHTRTRGRRIYGEMVALLVERGNPEAALALEALWNQVQRKHPFALLCGYPMLAMAGAALSGVISDTCTEHDTVIPTEAFATLGSSEARHREVVALQQKAASLEQALRAERAARDSAEAALRIRDEFISIASHELRTPISVLSAQTQLSLRRHGNQGALEPERVASTLKQVNTQADKLGRLVSQLLDVSRLDAGKLALEPRAMDLAQLVEQVVTAARPLSDRHSLDLVAPPTLECELDPLRIEQVLSNLLDNAIKYSPDGGAIDVVLGESEGTIELSVRDHGLGIPAAKRAQIFERFYQAHADCQRGMGLGLYVSRQIVALHGGDIRAEFPADGGTRVVVTLPAVGRRVAREPVLLLASN